MGCLGGSVKRGMLDFSSGQELRVVRWSPESASSTLGVEAAEDSQSLPLLLPLPASPSPKKKQRERERELEWLF